jgi:hypothetical protein
MRIAMDLIKKKIAMGHSAKKKEEERITVDPGGDEQKYLDPRVLLKVS